MKHNKKISEYKDGQLLTVVKGQLFPIAALAIGPGVTAIKKKKISDSVKYYLEHFSELKHPKTYQNEIRYLVRLEKFLLEKDLESLDQVGFESLLEYQKVLSKKVKASSVNRIFKIYRHFFSICLQMKFSYENPIKGLKRLPEKKNHFVPWTFNQYQKVLRTTEGVNRNVLIFMRLTGARPGEAINIKWLDINHDAGTIEFSSGKNDGEKRIFFITPKMSKFLHSLKMNRSLYLFAKKNGRPITVDGFYQYIKHRLMQLDLGHLAPYGMRHALASDLSNKSEANAFNIRDSLGHKKIETTLEYVHQNKKEQIKSLVKAGR